MPLSFPSKLQLIEGRHEQVAAMSAETDVLDDQTAHEETVLLEWTVHLRRRSPEKARLVFTAMAFSAFLGWLQFHALIFVLVGPLMIFTATAEYLLPIRYRLT